MTFTPSWSSGFLWF